MRALIPTGPRASLVAAACLTASLAAGPGWAQAPAQPACESIDPTTAEVNVREGVRLAKAGRFDQAVPLFRMAVRLDACAPDHLLLLARGLSRDNKRDEALTRYQEVITRFEGTMAAERAKTELADLQAQPAVPPPGDGADASGSGLADGRTVAPKTPWPLIGYGTAGVGAALIGVGVYFALDAQAADDDLQTAARQPNRARYDELVDQRDSGTTLAYVMYGIGGAAVVGGLVMALVVPGLDSGDAPQTGFMPLPEGGGLVQLGGRF